MHDQPHLTARLYGTPLLLARSKLDVILGALGPRLAGQAISFDGDAAPSAEMAVTPDGIAESIEVAATSRPSAASAASPSGRWPTRRPCRRPMPSPPNRKSRCPNPRGKSPSCDPAEVMAKGIRPEALRRPEIRTHLHACTDRSAHLGRSAEVRTERQLYP